MHGTPMQMLSGGFALIGAAAVPAALIYGYEYYNPRDPPGWLAALLRVYKRQIIAFCVLYAVSIAAFVLATIFKRYAL
jgi:hypothetical protein